MNHARIMSEFTWVNCYDFRSIAAQADPNETKSEVSSDEGSFVEATVYIILRLENVDTVKNVPRL